MPWLHGVCAQQCGVAVLIDKFFNCFSDAVSKDEVIQLPTSGHLENQICDPIR